MIRLFKHYVPHAVIFLGLCDLGLLLVAGDFVWTIRANQTGMNPGPLSEHVLPVAGFAITVWLAMVSVGVYRSQSLRSMRYAEARLLKAMSLLIIALFVLDFVVPGSTFWRSTLFYSMLLAILSLIAGRVALGAELGQAAFRRRIALPRKGEMSFVADRELKLPYYGERHMVKPGITGWAQISYPHGASIEDARQQPEYDLYYAKNYAPFLDLLILVQTLRVVLWSEVAR
ncbi:sugar transferase [Erythrobacter sp. LQ02-29]|uniref:sugar transferase n=1 Tax=Erythrobacter sp. LQ02-29 TaxID=2920384 RepID=UPI001F4E0EAA|nr:sugar transferase [Erythrobacter sp. LQ02-29]MCP9223372.1 sugar transferase [Erythrobacter sp. LQ02-29]